LDSSSTFDHLKTPSVMQTAPLNKATHL
jgi:hypothetical protein